ncbi:hypothetical protein B4096_1921 [Heyndrickxia coagulans]|nr:hypothetical protein B4096_1921 [Heyndrickxia coagulans]
MAICNGQAHYKQNSLSFQKWIPLVSPGQVRRSIQKPLTFLKKGGK